MLGPIETKLEPKNAVSASRETRKLRRPCGDPKTHARRLKFHIPTSNGMKQPFLTFKLDPQKM